MFAYLLHCLQQVSVLVRVAQLDMDTGKLSTVADAYCAETDRLCAPASFFIFYENLYHLPLR